MSNVIACLDCCCLSLLNTRVRAETACTDHIPRPLICLARRNYSEEVKKRFYSALSKKEVLKK